MGEIKYPNLGKFLQDDHRYSIDFSDALRKAKEFYLQRPDQKPVNIIRHLCRFIHAVKEDYR